MVSISIGSWNIFTIKLSEYDSLKLNKINSEIYNLITQIVDEFHSIVFKSENSYTIFFDYILNIKQIIRNKLIIKNDSENDAENDYNKNDSENDSENNAENEYNKNESNNDYIEYDIDESNDNENKILTFYNTTINNIIDNSLSSYNINNSIKEIKKDLPENDIFFNKFTDLEKILGINLFKNLKEDNDDNDDDDESINIDDISLIDYNNMFIKFVIKNIHFNVK